MAGQFRLIIRLEGVEGSWEVKTDENCAQATFSGKTTQGSATPPKVDVAGNLGPELGHQAAELKLRMEALTALRVLGVDHAENLVEQYAARRILAVVKSVAGRDRPMSNPAGFVWKALRHNWKV